VSEPAATEADAYEQQRPVLEPDEGTEDEEDQAAGGPTETPLDVDEADRAEQDVPVPLDEDDYR